MKGVKLDDFVFESYDKSELDNKFANTPSLTKENTFTGKQNFNGENEFNGGINANAGITLPNQKIKMLDKDKNIITQYGSDSIEINIAGQTYTLTFPQKTGTFAIEPIIQYSTFESTENGSSKEDTWKTTDPDTTLSMQHQNDSGQSGYSVSKNYTEMSSTLTTNGAITSTKLAITNDTATMKSEDGAGNSKQFKMTPTEMLFSERPKVTTNGETSDDVAIKGDLQNYVSTQSETTNGAKVYSQVTNENGAVAIRVFENGDADLQNLSITKDGVTINGKKPLTSVQPLYKHELVIPYSFSVTDPANGTATVNGSVIYHYLSNTETQITSASAIDDNFMLSGGIGKNSANTVLLFDVNVTKAGNSITAEAVSASTMGYITGTVGTITDTITQLI